MILNVWKGLCWGFVFFLLLWRRNLCQSFSKVIPTQLDKTHGKLWETSRETLVLVESVGIKPSASAKSQKLAKHLSDEFVSRIPKWQNWVYFFLKFSDANILAKGGGLQDQVVMQENYSFFIPLTVPLTVRKSYCQKEKPLIELSKLFRPFWFLVVY